MTRCQNCNDSVLIPGKGPIPRFCSTRCRVAAYRVHHQTSIPTELRKRARWIRHSTKKIPLTIDGKPASSTDPETWSTYRDALSSKVGVGLGFVLNGDGVMCFDLDHCVDNGQPNSAALRFLATLPQTYVEFSPSGDGLHVWGFGSVTRGSRRIVDGLQVETYSTGRYLTVTGKPFVAAPFAQLI